MDGAVARRRRSPARAQVRIDACCALGWASNSMWAAHDGALVYFLLFSKSLKKLTSSPSLKDLQNKSSGRAIFAETSLYSSKRSSRSTSVRKCQSLANSSIRSSRNIYQRSPSQNSGSTTATNSTSSRPSFSVLLLTKAALNCRKINCVNL